MSITTITIGTINYISYASLAEADAALAVDPVRKTAWAALSDDDKGANLIAATYRLDLLRWNGTKTGGAPQANAWPRTGLTYSDGTAVSTTAVPAEVERATILLAGTIAATPASANAGSSSQSTKSVKAGSAEIVFFHRSASVNGKPLQDETAYELIRQWLAGQNLANSTFGPLATGTGGSSSFSTSYPYDRTRGFS